MPASVAFAAEEKTADKSASKPARGAAEAAAAKPVVMVPAGALRDGSVFVLLDGKALRRAVKTGATSTQGVRVEQGLVGGEDLITNPPPGLKNGDAVRQKAATL
jgi:HlyD family secretion protein